MKCNKQETGFAVLGAVGSASWSASCKVGDIGYLFTRIRGCWFLANTLWCKANILTSHGESVIILSSGNKKYNCFTLHSSPPCSLFPLLHCCPDTHQRPQGNAASNYVEIGSPEGMPLALACLDIYRLQLRCPGRSSVWKTSLAEESQGPPLFLNASFQPTLPHPFASSPHAPSVLSITLERSARNCIFCWGQGFLPSSCVPLQKMKLRLLF